MKISERWDEREHYIQPRNPNPKSSQRTTVSGRQITGMIVDEMTPNTWLSPLTGAARRIDNDGDLELFMREGFTHARQRWTICQRGNVEFDGYVIKANGSMIGRSENLDIAKQMLGTFVEQQVAMAQRKIDEKLGVGAFKPAPPIPDEYGDW